MGKNHNL